MVHSTLIAEYLSDQYSLENISEFKKLLKPVLKIELGHRGIVQASNRGQKFHLKEDPTHYDAVWLRDSVWVARALLLDEPIKGTQVLKTMMDYMNSELQMKRMQDLIENPEKATGLGSEMRVPHIRFDGKSKNFDDVYENASPQQWNHKQNDALGIYLLTVLECFQNKLFPDATLENFKSLLTLPLYFQRVSFYTMADAGAWEEIERLNTSSVALVTASLEQLVVCLENNDFRRKMELAAKEFCLKQSLDFILSLDLFDLIQKGYETILKQLPQGESPSYLKTDLRYREADAALLNLIYPCKLKKLNYSDRVRILQHIYPLVGEVGIKRYLGDAYQAEGYWLGAESNIAEKTRDFSSEKDFFDRSRSFKKGKEAQWFFDSWFSFCLGEVYRESGDENYYDEQIYFFNRALGQITGGTLEDPVKGADGLPVPSFELPESYNVTANGFAPSPITPLNWAKASLRIAIDGMEKSICFEQR